MPTHLVLDIETIPDPELPRLDDSDRVTPPPFNQIVTMGCLLLEDYAPKRLGVVGEHKGEGEMLADFAQWLDAKKPTVVTWNGRGFDMPVITSRALRHGLSMPWWFSDRHTRYRYSPEGHFDLMDFLADFGAAKNARLDVYAKLVGFPGKVGVDGSQVLPLVHAGKIDEVHAALRFLARLDPHDGQGNVAAERFAQEFLHRQMAKKVATHLIQWHHGLAVVLRHQQEESRRRVRYLIYHEQDS